MSDTPSSGDGRETFVRSQRAHVARMAMNLSGMRRLHQLHTELATQTDLKAALEKIIAAACEYTRTDRGAVQLVSDDGSHLEMTAWRGYADDGPFISMFRREALEQGSETVRVEHKRTLVEDWTTTPNLDPEVRAMLQTEGIAASQSTPMVSRDGAILGVLSTQFRQPHRSSSEELKLIDVLAWMAADFVERHRGESLLRAREQRQTFLLDLSDALHPLTDATAIQSEACRLLGEALGVDRAYCVEVVEGRDEVRVSGNYLRGDSPSLEGAHRATDYGRVPEVMRRCEMVVIGDAQHAEQIPAAERPAMAAARIAALVNVPRLKEGRLVGALCVTECAPRQWTDAEIELLRETAERIWSSIESAGAAQALLENEQQQAFLLEFADALRPLADPQAIAETACRLLVEHLDVANAQFSEVEGEAGAEIASVCGEFVRSGKPLANRYPLVEFGEPLVAELRNGASLVLTDTARDPRLTPAQRAAFADIDSPAAVAAPLVRQGRLVAMFAAHDRVPRDWSAREVALIERVAERTWDAFGRARVQAAQRESATDLRQNRAWIAAQKEAFQAAMNDASLATSLGLLVRAVVGQLRGDPRCAFYVADQVGNGLRHVVSMPDSSTPRTDDFGISAESLACGLAVATGKAVITPDVRDDPRWRPWLSSASEKDYRACWSFPVATAEGTLVGWFALYFAEPREASARDLELTATLTQTAGIIISRQQETAERARAEAARSESELRYRSLFAAIDEGFCIMELVRDADGAVQDLLYREVNPAFTRLTGFSDVVGRRMSEVVPNLEAHWQAAWMRVAETGEPMHTENYVQAMDRWYSVAFSPLGDRYSGLIAIVFQDTSARKRSEQTLLERERQQAFLLQLGDALRAESEPDAAGRVATRMLAEHIGVDRGYICRLSHDQNLAWVEHEYHAQGLASAAGQYHFDDFPESLRGSFDTSLAIDDLGSDASLSEHDKGAIEAMGMHAVLTGILRKSGQGKVWALVVGDSSARAWSKADRAVVEDATERTWAAMERARAESALRENETRYRTVVESATDGIWLADHDGNFVDANAAACRMLGYSLQQYRQLNLRDLVHTRDEPRLRELINILGNGGQSTDIWNVRHADGHDVPVEASQTFTPGGYWQIIGRDVSERERTERNLQQRSEQFLTLLRESPFGVYLVDAAMRILVANPSAREGADGAGELVGEDFERTMHASWSDEYAEELAQRVREVLSSGEPCAVPEREERRGKDARWFSWYIRRTDIPGSGTGVVCYIGNVTAQVRARERQEMLLMEINHRVKNTLAVVQSIATQTLHNARTLDEADSALESRLFSLAKAHDVLTREHWDGAPLHDVVKNTLAAYPDRAGASRFHVNGVAIRLQPKAVVALSMALHELATNAVKYGALSGERGYVEIAWDIVGQGPERRFRFRWSEHHGPTVHAPKRHGFGSRLIERGLAMDMGGEVHLEFDPYGLCCRIDAPLGKISAEK